MSEQSTKKSGTLVRRLISMLITLLIIAALVAGAWYTRDKWMPTAQGWWQQAVAMFSDEETDPMAAPTPDGETVSHAQTSSGYVLPAIPDKPAVEQKSEPAVEETAPEGMDVAADTEVKSSTEMSPTTGMDEMASAQPHSEMAPAGLPPVMQPEDVPVLMQARAAFWQRDLATAEQLYQQQIAAEPSPDAWGELGNLYYVQAKWQQAANAYTEAALSLLDQNDYSRAMYLQYIVRGLDQQQAERINTRLREMQTASPAQ